MEGYVPFLKKKKRHTLELTNKLSQTIYKRDNEDLTIL